MTPQLPLPLLRPSRESDASVHWRARVAGWVPRPEHCPPETARLAAGWREDAERWLRARARVLG